MALANRSLLVSLISIKNFKFISAKQPVFYISSTSSNKIIKSHVASNQSATATATNSPQAVIPPPVLDVAGATKKEYSPKIVSLVDEISKLNLIEVSDLNELLRKKLNIKDVPMSFAGSFAPAAAGAGAAAAPKEEEKEADEQPKAVKTSFKLKIIKYDEAKKVALIKEIKALGENMNLVQAKKFIESVPQVFKDNINKDDAEKIKAQLEKQGAVCELE
jgi:large subunit ribosomal protein L7/L12